MPDPLDEYRLRPSPLDVLRRLPREELTGRGLPSGELSRAERDMPLILGGLNIPPPPRLPPPERVDALMPQTREESERLTNWRNVLPWMAMTLPPVSAYLGGQRMGRGWSEGDPWSMALGAGQAILAVPGVFNVASGLGRTVRREPPATSGPSQLDSLSTAALLAEARRVRGEADRLIDRAAPSTATSNTERLYALAPTGRESSDRMVDFGANSLFMHAGPLRLASPGPRATETGAARVNPNLASETARTEFHALQPGAAFLRIAGGTEATFRNAYMALRRSGGDYDAAIRFLGETRPAAQSLLRAWQARGVDAGQALRYWQGLGELGRLERPPHGGHADGGAVDPLDQYRPPVATTPKSR